MNHLERAMGRLKAGQQLEDLPGYQLWALLQFFEAVQSPQAECVHAELLRRNTGAPDQQTADACTQENDDRHQSRT